MIFISAINLRTPGDWQENAMGIGRREFLKLSGAGLALTSLDPRILFSSSPLSEYSPSLLREQLFNKEYPFPYDEKYFACAERIYNVRASGDNTQSFKANLNLVLKEGKKLDIKVLVSERLEDLSRTKEIYAYSGVQENLDVLLTGFESRRLYYQVLYREGEESWKALSPKSFKLPNAKLEKGDEITIVFISDDHTFDDADYEVPEIHRNIKLSGDYVNEFLKTLRFNPDSRCEDPVNRLRNGFCLATALRYIMAYEDPDFLIHFGDTTGIGANYKWKGLGLPIENLSEKDYDFISKILWLRMRKMYSALTPSIPIYIALGNHDGEEAWNPVKFRAKEWRKKLFALPDELTYPEGGHSEGNYYAFSWGADSLNRGGVLFIVLHTTGFTGNRYPQTPEEWTLGQDQLQWFEDVLRKSEKDWSFVCSHHVLGGWPAGPDENRKEIAYGRGPLFNYTDYLDYCDPNKVEQVKLTEFAKKMGLRAFIYGHDHIFNTERLGKGLNQKEMLGVCVGSTKYLGESMWWSGNYWRKHYGDAFKTNPDFWGPTGITKLTINKEEAKLEYVITGCTPRSNLPQGVRTGDVLYSTILVNPPPSLSCDRTSLLFKGVEGDSDPPSQIFKIKNGGAGALNYEIKCSESWISVSPESGCSFGEWDEISVSVDISSFESGTYEGMITVESREGAKSAQKIKINLSIDPPPIYAPLNFAYVRKENKILFYSEIMIFLTWEAHPLNKNIQKYLIYLVDGEDRNLLAEVDAQTFSYLLRNVEREKHYRFALTAVDHKEREGQPAYLIID